MVRLVKNKWGGDYRPRRPINWLKVAIHVVHHTRGEVGVSRSGRQSTHRHTEERIQIAIKRGAPGPKSERSLSFVRHARKCLAEIFYGYPRSAAIVRTLAAISVHLHPGFLKPDGVIGPHSVRIPRVHNEGKRSQPRLALENSPEPLVRFRAQFLIGAQLRTIRLTEIYELGIYSPAVLLPRSARHQEHSPRTMQQYPIGMWSTLGKTHAGCPQKVLPNGQHSSPPQIQTSLCNNTHARTRPPRPSREIAPPRPAPNRRNTRIVVWTSTTPPPTSRSLPTTRHQETSQRT